MIKIILHSLFNCYAFLNLINVLCLQCFGTRHDVISKLGTPYTIGWYVILKRRRKKCYKNINELDFDQKFHPEIL